MTGITSTNTIPRKRVPEMGLLGKKAVIDHAIEHGLSDPEEIGHGDRCVRVWLTGTVEESDAWVDTIHVDDTVVEPLRRGRERVRVTGRLPLLGIRVEIRFSRPAATTRIQGLPRKGDRARILRGAHDGREGVVQSVFRGMAGGHVTEVLLEVPRFIGEPDGPTYEVVLPFARDEIEVVS
ncbi:hypothetical protein [Nocardioides lacusdianchii]|uniref:hypothetical protein n=1 Tax=Nocardioides lacusdianchii TaxID=2783664 RepID=UPI001CCB3B72|nr:hypothetical protein [Nocardioides lacusdianchii]